MKKLFVLLFTLMLLIPNIVNAECTEEELKQDTIEANKIEIETEHYSGTYFYTKVNNITPNLYVTNSRAEKYTNSDASLNSYSGNTIKYFVISNRCKKIVREINVKYKKYNKYNDTEECFLHPDFKYCEKFETDDIKKITEEEFKKEYKEYKKETANKTKFDNKYIVGISVGVSLIIIFVIIFVVKKKKNKNKKF